MTDLDRQGLQVLAEGLGRARLALTSRIGDTDRNPASQLALEAALCRLRGSTLFHDTDYAKDFLQFGSVDPVGLGVQGAVLGGTPASSPAFPVPFGQQVWSPGLYGPPCPEGWAVWQYDGWQGYQPSPITQLSEPSSGSGRLTYPHPVRYDGFGAQPTNTYQRVAYWGRARWLSVFNSRGSAISPSAISVAFTFTDDQLSGVCQRDPLTGLPLDVRAYTHPLLVQGSGNPASWQEIALPEVGAPLEALPTVVSSAGAGLWTVTVGVPSDLSAWTPGTWWHVILYWGSRDSQAILPPPSLTTHSDVGSDLPVILWPAKNFFRNDLEDRVAWATDDVNGPAPFLVARHRTHFSFTDGSSGADSLPGEPDRYAMAQSFPPVASYPSESLSGLASLKRGCAVGVLLLGVTTGTDDTSTLSLTLAVGPQITPEFFPADWNLCPYFPPAPDESIVLGRAILTRAPSSVYGVSDGASLANVFAGVDGASPGSTAPAYGLAVAWMRQDVPSHAIPPIGDATLSSYLLSSLTGLTQRFRSLGADGPTLNAAFSLLVSGVGVPSSLAPTRSSMLDPTAKPSSVFRGLLKNPYRDSLVERPDGDPLAIPFDAPGVALIDALTGAPPSTELMRLDSDLLRVLPVTLPTPYSLELYQESSGQCASVDVNAAGTRLGQDYTFRLLLEDGQQDVLTKDWFVMASKYFLTPQEYAQQVTADNTTGYFTQSTLDTISEYRLYGTSALVPDMSMGTARALDTRQASPPDSTQVTQAQFVANLQAQGETPAEIQEAILEFTEDGGSFYIVDENKYPNIFTRVVSAGVAVTQYTFSTVAYWASSGGFFDSFMVAPSGLPAGALETGGGVILASFNRPTDSHSPLLPPPNSLRTVGVVYTVEGHWAYTSSPLASAQPLSVYPRAENIGTTQSPNWQYIPFSQDVWACVRCVSGEVVSDHTVHFAKYDASTNPANPSPVSLGGPYDGVGFLGVGKAASDLQTGTNGAPPGDILVLRSA